MNLARLTHPRHLLAAAINRRAAHEAAHLKRLKDKEELAAAQQAVAAQTGRNLPPRPGPS